MRDHVSLPDKPGGRGGGARVALQTSSSVVGGEHVHSEVWAGPKPFWVGVGGETGGREGEGKEEGEGVGREGGRGISVLFIYSW